MSSPPTDLARATNRFALSLWSHAPAGNVAISPASVATALVILWGGAKGDTATQIQSMLQLEGEPDALLSRWGLLYRSLAESPRDITLHVANRLYGERSYPFDTVYFTIIRKAFDVWIEPVDFSIEPEAVRQKINTWVAEQTRQRITDLLPPRSIDRETRLAIVNAIYFLGNWASAFDPAQTRPREFYVDGKKPKQVPTMSKQARLRFAAAGGASLVELPYEGGSAAMYVIVPDARDGLAALEQQLATKLPALQSKLTEQDVAVSLPRFTIDPSGPLDLTGALRALGMTDAFDGRRADFTNIAKPKSEQDRLSVSAVLHKAFVKVDEQGTEAAAATAIVMPRGRPRIAQLVADHPFLFAIVDRASGLILFMGRVVDPT